MQLSAAAVILVPIERVVVMGRGAAGRSTAAAELGRITGLPVIELDKQFWRPGLAPMSRDEWMTAQHELAASGRWISRGGRERADVWWWQLSRRLRSRAVALDAAATFAAGAAVHIVPPRQGHAGGAGSPLAT